MKSMLVIFLIACGNPVDALNLPAAMSEVKASLAKHGLKATEGVTITVGLERFVKPKVGQYQADKIQLSVEIESQQLLKAVLIHEVGHAMGLPHSDNPVDIMYPEPQALAVDTAVGQLLEACTKKKCRKRFNITLGEP